MLDIAGGLVVNATWLAIGLSAQFMYLRFRDRHLRHIFADTWKAGRTVVVLSNIATTGTANEYTRPSTGMGEVQALSSLVAILNRSYAQRTRIEVIPSLNPLPSSSLRHNTICIGGTQYNSATRLFSKLILNPALDVDNTPPKSIVDKVSGKRYEPEIDAQGNVVIDYGIITSMTNPMGPSRRVLILRGSHTYGVAGCAEFLACRDASGVRRLSEVYRSSAWQALIKTQVLPDGGVIASFVEAHEITGG